MFFQHAFVSSSSHQNLMLMASARIVLWVLAELLILVNRLWLHLPFNEMLAHGILTLFAIIALTSFAQARSSREITPRSTLRQLSVDVLIMTWLFHVSGGATNPFVSILLFPLTISAAILPSRFTWFMVVLTLTSYGSLFLPDFFSPDFFSPDSGSTEPLVDHSQHNQGQGAQSVFSLHIVGMWFNFAISAILISFFVVKMRQQIQVQQEKINTHREKALRDEQLLGIATQAASAAHHISTPLSTMAVVINDLKADPSSKLFKEDLKVLSAQLDNCKQVLNTLRLREDTSSPILLSVFMAQLVDEFRLMRPESTLEEDNKTNTEELKALTIAADPSLRMALLNVLNNAADASPTKIRLNLNYDKRNGTSHKKNILHIHIRDFGHGLPEQFSKAAFMNGASPIKSSKPNGMGIGLFLSHATIEQHHGKISLTNMDPGTLTHITLPL